MSEQENTIQQLEAKAAAGDAESQYYLGVCLAQGIGTEIDHDAALEWVTMAAGQGHTSAQIWLGNLYLSAHDEEQARYWYEQAAVQGNADAMYYLSLIYMRGNVFGADPDIAFQWLNKAAENGHIQAMSRLAYMYCLGQGVEQSYEQATVWFEKAAFNGDTTAQAILASAFLTGCAVPQHESSAIYWFSQIKQTCTSTRTLLTLADTVLEGTLIPSAPVASYVLLRIHGAIFPDIKVNLDTLIGTLTDEQIAQGNRVVDAVLDDGVAIKVQ